MSTEGLAQFFTFGQYLGDRTSFRGDSLLPAASVLEFDLATGSVRIESYGGGGTGQRRAGNTAASA